MLKLDLHKKPSWLELAPGVRVQLLPLTTALMVSSRGDLSVEILSDESSDEDRALVFAKALGRRAVIAWEGVGDADGEVLDLTPAGVDALLDLYPIFDAFQEGYVAKGLLLESEKNVSAPSPNGTSAGAIGTAKPAKSRARNVRRK